MNARLVLAAVGAGNTTALLLVVGRHVSSRGATAELPFELLVGRVLPFGIIAAIVLLGASRYLDRTERDVRPLSGAYAAPGYAVPVVSVIRDASVVPPPTSIEVAVVTVVSASAMYVLVWFAEGPEAP